MTKRASVQAANRDFLHELWPYLQYTTYTPDRTIVGLGEAADRLIMVVSGEMVVYSEDEDNINSDTCVFKAGDFIGDYSLLGL